MSGTAMSLTAAESGFVVLLLSVSVVQGLNDWGVTYTSTGICALKGSTVDISCTYRYPSRMTDRDTTVEETFWFIHSQGEEPVDLRTRSEYSGRVQYICGNNNCTLRIIDLRESDSAEYKFRFITNQPGGEYTGLPGVTLSVTGFQVLINRSEPCKTTTCTWSDLRCHSSCRLPDQTSYIWYKNEHKITDKTSSDYYFYFYPDDSFSCAVEGYENFPSPPVYPPRVPSVSVSPSGEIVEGSSVNLTCSSDANPAANYTWYKEDEDSPKASGQIFTITDFRPEHSGNYYCEAQNRRGRHNSTLHLIVVAGAWKSAALGTITAVFLVITLLAVFLWIRRNMSCTQLSQGGERPDNRAQPNMSPAAAQRQSEEQQDDLHYASICFPQNQEDALYSNIRYAQPHRRTEDEEGGVIYSAIKTDNASSAPGRRRQEDVEDSCALYSTVNKNTVSTT
ncbi:B-cell receptor CD22-like [Dicentrarchus labrax]|uniref:B-cell receptor CD22-like n=1 Tax=Dicentrarchus labrax TaxID=13489 RepID=UPI0021F6015A|nr:B-cell receptor CD22-like [Dicentrarchus labrax]